MKEEVLTNDEKGIFRLNYDLALLVGQSRQEAIIAGAKALMNAAEWEIEWEKYTQDKKRQSNY